MSPKYPPFYLEELQKAEDERFLAELDKILLPPAREPLQVVLDRMYKQPLRRDVMYLTKELWDDIVKLDK